ncbi:14801_t:CDS:10 [Funneliformis caledonium]|uniref:14801_t:CDS:1 n=1 Tax=Funneliformis caledonium TaxID=1117310 RepID=A0A9N8W5C2_9GLOM|nr:14801_t:CDS:10 [Funneliformis caledonium]
MTDSLSPVVDGSFDFDDAELSFGSIDANFAKGLDTLEKNVSSFFQDKSKQPTSSFQNSTQDNGNSTRELNPVDENKFTFNVSRLLNNEETTNGRKMSDAGDAKSARNRRNNPRWPPNAPSRNTQMTLKEQERVIDEIKKENFSLKMKVYFLEERVSKMGPDEMERALKENVEIKMQNHELTVTLKERNKLLLDAEKAIQMLHQSGTTLQNGTSPSEETELELHRARDTIDELRKERDEAQRKFVEQKEANKRLRETVKRIKPDGSFDFDSMDSFDSRQSTQNPELQHYKELLQKEREEKQNISNEANGLRRQLLDVKNQMQGTNAELTELRRLQEDTIKNFEGLQNGDEEIVDNREMMKRIKGAADKARQEEAEKHSVLIQQLKGQISNLKALKHENEAELELIRSRPMSSASSRGDISSRIMNGEFSDQYEESLGLLRDKVAELTLQLRNKSTEVDHLIVELETSNVANQDLEEDMDRMESELKEYIDRLLEELDICHQDNEQLVADLNAVDHDRKEDLSHTQETISDLKLQLDNHKREIEELTQSLDKTRMELELKTKNIEHDEKKLSMNEVKVTELLAVKDSTDKQLDLLRQEVENYSTQIDEMKKDLDYEVEQRNAAESREKELMAERNSERELYEKEVDKARKDKKDNEKQNDQRLNELIEKLSAAEQQMSDLNMTIQERDADLQYANQQLSNQTSRTKETAERYAREQERLRVELDTSRHESERLRTLLENLGDKLENQKNQIIEYENEMKHLNNQRTKLNEKLSSSESARAKAEEVFRNLQMDVRDQNSTIEELKAQVAHLENNLTQEKKATYSNETQYREQIIERNTLLMTTYQYLDNIMSDGTNKQSNYPKPSANFALFHEHLLSKLKTLSHVYNTFDLRTKEIDNRWQEQYESLKNQMDIKLRLLNKFEGMIQKATVAQKDWRDQAKRNQGQLEAAKNINEELTDKLSVMREQLDELKASNARAEEAESKLKEAERHARIMESKMKEEERKWTARLKDLEYREIQSEERLKVEKQGAKEKVESLVENIKGFETQIQALNRRNNELQELITIQKASMEAANENKTITAKAEHTFSMLNEQLCEQLEEKNKTIEAERQRLKELQDQFSGIMEEHKRLQAQIEKREAMINKVFSGLQIINQRKDLIESVVLRKDLEEMQNSLMLDDSQKKIVYHPPAFINPPWRPGGLNTRAAKKAKEKSSSKTSSIPTYSSLKSRNLSKSGIPTRQSSNDKHNANITHTGSVTHRATSSKETK